MRVRDTLWGFLLTLHNPDEGGEAMAFFSVREIKQPFGNLCFVTNLNSIFQQVIAQRLVDTQRGHHITLGDAAQNISDMQRGEVKWDASAHFSGSTVSVGGFVIDDSGTKRNSILSPPKIFCDLENNKIIEHFSDLDMTSKVVIGRGASGEVFTVLHRPTGKQVAVKVIKAHEQRQMEEITKELRTLFDNKCSSIVTFHGSFFDSGAIYIALEKMEESLNSAVKTRGLATEEAARACIFQSLLALHHLHTQRKTIHRDIKPANILYNAEGEVKVSDFGVSSGPVASLDGNMASTFIGTLAYMSPERCRGCEYSFASDVWSLGLVLYYLVTGILPFNTQNPIFAIIEADPPDLRKDCPTLSQGALDFFAKCVSKDPEERSSCQDLLEHPWLAGLTLGLVKYVALLTTIAIEMNQHQKNNITKQDQHANLAGRYCSKIGTEFDAHISRREHAGTGVCCFGRCTR